MSEQINSRSHHPAPDNHLYILRALSKRPRTLCGECFRTGAPAGAKLALSQDSDRSPESRACTNYGRQSRNWTSGIIEARSANAKTLIRQGPRWE